MEHFSSELLKSIHADTLCGISPTCQIEEVDQDFYHVSVCYELDKPGSQDDCAVCISMEENPAFVWGPHLTPEDGFIMQQHIFRTPALIFRYENKTVILFPDTEAMKKQAVPWYLDLNAPKGKMYIGMSKSQIPIHVLYKKAQGANYPAGKSEIAFYLILKDEAMENPFRPVLDFYWSRYGCVDATSVSPAKKPLAPYVKHTYDWAFKRWKHAVWQEFELNGKQVGAPVFIVNTTQSPNYPGKVRERELRSIWNQAWFCSLRSASGLYRYAERTQNAEYLEYAKMTTVS